MLWLLIARATSSCVLQLKSDGSQVEQGYSVAAVSLPGTDQHSEQMSYGTVNNKIVQYCVGRGGTQLIN